MRILLAILVITLQACKPTQKLGVDSNFVSFTNEKDYDTAILRNPKGGKLYSLCCKSDAQNDKGLNEIASVSFELDAKSGEIQYCKFNTDSTGPQTFRFLKDEAVRLENTKKRTTQLFVIKIGGQDKGNYYCVSFIRFVESGFLDTLAKTNTDGLLLWLD